jgi:hypothetical protein
MSALESVYVFTAIIFKCPQASASAIMKISIEMAWDCTRVVFVLVVVVFCDFGFDFSVCH